MVDIQGRQLCRGCLGKLAAPPEGAPYPAGAPVMPRGRHVSWGALFFFSLFFPTGVNYLYMGLIKRGLAALIGFFFLIYLIGVSNMPLTLLLGLGLPIYILTCIFDGFSIRRRIVAGEAVADNIDEVVTFLRRNKVVAWIILAIIAFSVFGTVVGMFIGLIRWLTPFLIIIGGIYLLIKRKNPPGPPQE